MNNKRRAKKGQTEVCITNPEVLLRIDRIREEVKTLLGCERHPGIQVVLDCLAQWWESEDQGVREDFVKNIWTTPVVGYPNSSRQNPGQFASRREIETAKERIRRGREGR